MDSDSCVVATTRETTTNSGLALRDEGIQLTLSLDQEWLKASLQALQTFADKPEWSTFKLEDFRAWYAVQPHSHKCWGALTNRAVKAGIIRWTGRFAQSVSPKTHGHYVKVWTK